MGANLAHIVDRERRMLHVNEERIVTSIFGKIYHLRVCAEFDSKRL